MSKLYAVIEEVCCGVEDAVRLMSKASHYLEFETVGVPFSPLLRFDGKSQNHADYRILDRSTKHLKDVGAVQIEGYRTKTWAGCRFYFYQFSEDSEDAVRAVHTVVYNGLLFDGYLPEPDKDTHLATSAVHDRSAQVHNLTVKTNRHDTYRHLFALCQNDALFTIIDYGGNWHDEDWERIIVSSQQEIKRLGGVPGAVIGTVRLLPAGENTVIMFVDKDAIHHHPIPEGGAELFAMFADRARDHFAEIGVLQPTTPGTTDTPQEGILAPKYRAKLRRNLVECFNLDELRTLCFDMGIKYENLLAFTLDGMARELVDYCKRAGKIRELVAKCRELRPNISWEGDYE